MKDQDGNTALMKASKNGRIQVVELLLRKGAQINFKNKDGKSALDLATENVQSILKK